MTKQRVECPEFGLLHNFKGINAQLHNRELIFFFLLLADKLITAQQWKFFSNLGTEKKCIAY